MAWILDVSQEKHIIDKMLNSFVGGYAYIQKNNRHNFFGKICDIDFSAGSIDIVFISLMSRGPRQRKMRACKISSLSLSLPSRDEVRHECGSEGEIEIALEDGTLYLREEDDPRNILED